MASTGIDNEVLTLSKAAMYLRVSEDEVLELAERAELPGRRIGREWRFIKEALGDWLRRPSAKERLLRHAGIAKDDPYMQAMLENIYQARGRSMIENGG
jgi:excisionase family DNA binding protein